MLDCLSGFCLALYAVVCMFGLLCVLITAFTTTAHDYMMIMFVGRE